MNLYYSPLEALQFMGWTFLSNIPLWIMIYFDKKDDGAWTGLLGQQILGWSRLK